MSKPVKQVHLGAAFPGVNSNTVWSDPRSGSQIDFSPSATSHRQPSAESSTCSSWRKGCG
jgi:hypothetical protein